MENINNISILIVLIILSFGILGLKRGVIKEAAVVLGNIAAIILAFLLMRHLYLELPFHPIFKI